MLKNIAPDQDLHCLHKIQEVPQNSNTKTNQTPLNFEMDVSNTVKWMGPLNINGLRTI